MATGDLLLRGLGLLHQLNFLILDFGDVGLAGVNFVGEGAIFLVLARLQLLVGVFFNLVFFVSTSSSSRLRSVSVCLMRLLAASSCACVAAARARKVSRSGAMWASSCWTRRIFRSRSCKIKSFSIVSCIELWSLAGEAIQVNFSSTVGIVLNLVAAVLRHRRALPQRRTHHLKLGHCFRVRLPRTGQLRLRAACVILQIDCERELGKIAGVRIGRSRGHAGDVAKAVARARGEAAGDV